MRVSIIKSTFLIFIFIGCEKENVKNTTLNGKGNFKLLSEYFNDLRIKPLDTVDLSNNSKDLKSFFDRKKTSGMIHLRDSVWTAGAGTSSFYESDKMVVTPGNLSYIYPGSLLRAASIALDKFETFSGYQTAPISVQLSFPSSLSIGSHSLPSLSNSRVFLRNALMAPDFSGNTILNYTDYFAAFSKYDEVKYAFGYNVNQHKLFSSTNTNFDSYSSGTYYSTKVMASYTVENFTYAMSDPTSGELIDMASIPVSAFDGISPVYVNSVTYGRFGLLVLESNNNSYSMRSAFEKLVKKILKKTTESYTREETDLFASCRITIYLLGSTIGNNVIQLLINPSPEGVSDFLSQNIGTFTASDPGVPISYTAKYLKDNSSFKTIFRIDH